jgi:hypothetical protein
VKIPIGGGYIEADEGVRDSRFHFGIVKVIPIPNTLSGHNVTLECGHVVTAFGNLSHANGVVLCTTCRDNDEAQW